MDANAADAAGGIGCLCKAWELAAALRCALKLGMCCCPFAPVSNAEPSLCYSVEHVDTNSLEEDSDDHEDSSTPEHPKGVEGFRARCKEYFEKCSETTGISIMKNSSS